MRETRPAEDPGSALITIYDRALPQVYGYLFARVHNATIAEDLTAETFLAAAEAVQRRTIPEVTVPWLVTVARNKLVDHWRRRSREERKLARVEPNDIVEDGTDLHLDRQRAREVLASLGPHHQAALTLRYLDGLPVPEVASHLDRTVAATEALLVRARRAFRHRYEEGGPDVA